MRSRYFWLFLLLIAIGLFSFRSKDATIEVYGKVLHKDQGLSSVEVAVFREDLDYPYPYFEPTTSTGDFRLKFNIYEGRPVRIHYTRKGYSTLIVEKTFSGKKTRESLGEIELIRLPGEKDDYQFGPLKTSGYPYLLVFPEKDTHIMPDNIQPRNIQYFNYIEKQECSELHGAFWYYVNFQVEGDKEAVKGYVLQ